MEEPGVGAITTRGQDSPDEMKPLASAWAILPAPMNPILRAAMLGVWTVAGRGDHFMRLLGNEI